MSKYGILSMRKCHILTLYLGINLLRDANTMILDKIIYFNQIVSIIDGYWLKVYMSIQVCTHICLYMSLHKVHYSIRYDIVKL